MSLATHLLSNLDASSAGTDHSNILASHVNASFRPETRVEHGPLEVFITGPVRKVSLGCETGACRPVPGPERLTVIALY